jgi:hypothetical protein
MRVGKFILKGFFPTILMSHMFLFVLNGRFLRGGFLPFRLNIQLVEVRNFTTWSVFSTLKYVHLPRGLFQHVEMPTCTTWSIFNTLKYPPVAHGLYSTLWISYLYHVL